MEAVVANPHRIVRRFVLKIAHAAEDPAVIDMENAALQHLAAVASDLPLPRLVRTLAGEPTTTIDGPAGTHLVRVITALPGRALQSRVHEGQPVSQITAEAVGARCPRLSVALQGFFHPAAGRELDWDVRRLRELSARRGAPRIPSRTAHALARLTALPAGVQHGDVTLTNVLTDTDGVLTGIVDLGDMHHTAAVCDLAATLTSVLRGVEARRSGRSPPRCCAAISVTARCNPPRWTCWGAGDRPVADHARCLGPPGAAASRQHRLHHPVRR
ncbi:MAG: phosphotransferase [Kineosporiaceae bacterium]|nr:phosphotransferase [Kineosporiaceae bacterium]